jgi:hypothetical protein
MASMAARQVRRHHRITVIPAGRRARLSRLLGRSPQGPPLVLGGTSPHTRGDPVINRPGQARSPRWAGQADSFRLVDLAQRGPDRADREEEFCVHVAAGGLVTPVGPDGHRGHFAVAWRITVWVAENPIRIAYSLPSS